MCLYASVRCIYMYNLLNLALKFIKKHLYLSECFFILSLGLFYLLDQFLLLVYQEFKTKNDQRTFWNWFHFGVLSDIKISCWKQCSLPSLPFPNWSKKFDSPHRYLSSHSLSYTKKIMALGIDFCAINICTSVHVAELLIFYRFSQINENFLIFGLVSSWGRGQFLRL